MPERFGFRNVERLNTSERVKVFSLAETPKTTPEDMPKPLETRTEDTTLNASMSEKDAMHYYESAGYERAEIDGEKFEVPFVGDERDHYLEYPDRVREMDYGVAKKFEIDKGIEPFSSVFIERSIKEGKKITNGRVLGVAGYDPGQNRLLVREAGYFDSFATNNAGLDINTKDVLGEELVVDAVAYGNLRNLESPHGALRPFEQSYLANVLGVGGIMVSSDGYLLFPQRRSDLGPTSLGGKFGLSASGVVHWDQPKLDQLGIQGYMGSAIEEEVAEELALKPSRINLDKFFLSSIERYIETETGIDAKHECQISPICFSRDLMRGGKPQMFYYIQTTLDSEQIPERMAGAVDSKKEFTRVNMFPLDKESLKVILGNKDERFIFNHEARGILGLMLASEKGRKVLDVK